MAYICTDCGYSHENQFTDFPDGAAVVVTADFTGSFDLEKYNPLIHKMSDAPRITIPAGSKGTIVGHCDDGRVIVEFEAEKGRNKSGHTFHQPEEFFRVEWTAIDILKAISDKITDTDLDFAGPSGLIRVPLSRQEIDAIRAALVQAEGGER